MDLGPQPAAVVPLAAVLLPHSGGLCATCRADPSVWAVALWPLQRAVLLLNPQVLGASLQVEIKPVFLWKCPPLFPFASCLKLCMELFLLWVFCLFDWVFIFFFSSLQLGQSQDPVSTEASVAQNTLIGQEFHLSSAQA